MTLRHIVSWKLNGATLEERDAQATEISEALLALENTIPEIRAISVHRNELHDGSNFDLTLIADFDDAAALAVYAVHPEHLPVIDLVKARSEGRVAVDFTI